MGESRLAAWWRSRFSRNQIGPYRRSQPLGHSLAGPVHLAYPRGGGPAVALRVLRGDWADRPAYAARWVRSLHGVSLLDHPHVARVQALGETGTAPWAAWEFVPGPTLGETLASAPTPEAALVALLQAARGLSALHERGLWHGGFGPDAARGTVESGIKLVDAGWPRDPDADDDLGPVPLRRREAADERVQRETAEAQDEQQRRQDLAAFGRLMQTAKAVQDRSDLREMAERLATPPTDAAPPPAREVVRALESALGLEGAGFQPHPSEREALHEATARWRDTTAAQTWRRAVAIVSGVLGLLILLAILAKAWLVVMGLSLLGLLTILACLAAAAIGVRDPVVDRARALAFGLRGPDLATAAAVLLLAIVVLGVIGALRPLIVLGTAAVVLAVLYRRELVRRLRQERQAPREMAAALVSGLRRQGIAESAIREFFAKEGSPGLYEAVFATAFPPSRSIGEPPVDRAVCWLRDRVIGFLDARLQRRQDATRRALFVALEGRRQTAGGVNLLTARRRSWRVADALVVTAASIREADAPGAVTSIGPTLRAAAMAPEAILVEHETVDRPALWRRATDVIFGPRARFLVGAVLLSGCVLWMHQNGMLPHARLRELAEQAAQVRDLESAREVGEAAGRLPLRVSGPTRSLHLPGVPDALTALVSRLGAGVAGLLLLVSSLRDNRRTLGLVWLGAVIALFGTRGAGLALPSILAMAAGAALGVLAMFIPAPRE